MMMVQLLADPALSQNGGPIHEAAEGWMPREEQAQRAKDLSAKRMWMRTPRQGRTTSDYQDDKAVPHVGHGCASQVDCQAPIPENAVLACAVTRQCAPTTDKTEQLPQRPRLPPPRRSYSVTDKEPEPVAPGQPRPSGRMTLLDLPSEIHYALLDLLDPIDGVCLGLAHSRLYGIHRRKYGTVPLCSRYPGPNDMEWAWRGAGPLLRPTGVDGEDRRGNKLGRLRVQGQVYCRKCGISRCELHRHLKEWMGDGYEYCEIRKTYGRPADADAKPYCFMSSPKNPRQCGRHGGARG